jgi:hypothetical protein
VGHNVVVSSRRPVNRGHRSGAHVANARRGSCDRVRRVAPFQCPALWLRALRPQRDMTSKSRVTPRRSAVVAPALAKATRRASTRTSQGDSPTARPTTELGRTIATAHRSTRRRTSTRALVYRSNSPHSSDRNRRDAAAHAPSSDTCSAFVRSISVATPTSLLRAASRGERTWPGDAGRSIAGDVALGDHALGGDPH